ncbi:MAG: transcriptional regulator [Paenibacillaceae bacterium]|jgi:AraC-like DNA-binding protein|nr:transcriptional regulator [Paenibacillaceae bacterium]
MRIREKKTLFSRKKPSYYKKLLVLIVLSANIPALFLSAAFYYLGNSSLRSEIGDSHQYRLKNIFGGIGEQFNQVEASVKKWSFNQTFDESRRNIRYEQEPGAINELYYTMTLMTNTSPIIDGISFYNANEDLMIGNQRETRRTKDTKEKGMLDAVLKALPMSLWLNAEEFDYFRDEQAFKYAYAQKVPVTGVTPYGVVFASIKKEAIEKLFKQAGLERGEAILMLDGTGSIIASYKNNSEYKDEQFNWLVNSIMTKLSDSPSPQEADTYTLSSENEKFLVTSDIYENTGWKLVVITPYSKMLSTVVRLAKLSIIICSLCTLLILLLSWLSARRMYKPIQRLSRLLPEDPGAAVDIQQTDELGRIEKNWNALLKERTEMKVNLEKSLEIFTEAFFLQLIQGYYKFTGKTELKDKLQQLGWEAEDKIFAMVFFRLLTYEGSGRKFKEGDEALVAFSASNIVRELSSAVAAKSVTVNLDNMSIVALSAFDARQPEEHLRREVLDFSQRTIQSLVQYLGVDSVAMTSRLAWNAEDIHGRFEEVRQALYYREIAQINHVLSFEAMMPDEEALFLYPYEIEHSIIDSLSDGNETAAHAGIGDFLQYAKNNSKQEYLFTQKILQLTGTLLNLCGELNIDTVQVLQGKDIYLETVSTKDPVKVHAALSLIASRIISINEAQNRSRHKEIVDKTMEVIAGKYMADLSLEEYAEMVGATPHKLSIAFKKVTDRSFTDYLTYYRIEKAKDLLKHSEDSAASIALQVGYQPSYFSRVFKKMVGSTPGEFRERNRMD